MPLKIPNTQTHASSLYSIFPKMLLYSQVQHPSSLAPTLLPPAQICVVTLDNSLCGGVRFGTEALQWLSCISCIPNRLYCSLPRLTLLLVHHQQCHSHLQHKPSRFLVWTDMVHKQLTKRRNIIFVCFQIIPETQRVFYVYQNCIIYYTPRYGTLLCL